MSLIAGAEQILVAASQIERHQSEAVRILFAILDHFVAVGYSIPGRKVEENVCATLRELFIRSAKERLKFIEYQKY
jgi:hypothetical protein